MGILLLSILLTFWLTLGIIALSTIFATKYGSFHCFLWILFTALYLSFDNDNLLAIFKNFPLHIVFLIISYLIIGYAIALIKWMLYVEESSNRFLELKTSDPWRDNASVIIELKEKYNYKNFPPNIHDNLEFLFMNIFYWPGFLILIPFAFVFKIIYRIIMHIANLIFRPFNRIVSNKIQIKE